MPPSFGNAVVAANQQWICNLSSWDAHCPPTGRAIMHKTPSLVEIPKWRVKWKTVNQTSCQTSATTIISGITPSNSSPVLPQVLARSAANGWKSASNIQGSYRMQQNPFVRMQDGCTFNAGHVTAYGVHIGPWHATPTRSTLQRTTPHPCGTKGLHKGSVKEYVSCMSMP